MVSEDQVLDLLLHLNSPAFLLLHPLAEHLASPAARRDEALRELLLKAIDHLKPPAGTPEDDPGWRAWRVIWLRFVCRRPREEIEEVMGLGDRQLRREQSRGIAAITVLLNEDLERLERKRKALGREDAPEGH